MAEIRSWSDRYAAIAAELIGEEEALGPIAASDVRIAYLSSDAAKKSGGKTVFGQCEKVPEKFKWAVPYDFTVTVFEPNVQSFTENHLRALVLHELLHVGVDVDENGVERYRIVPHDYGEFREVERRFGLGWQSKQQLEWTTM